MAGQAIDWSRRKPVNVVDPGLQARVGKLVDEAMRPVLRAIFPTRDAAAKACARVMRPITNQYGVEVGALLFSLTGAGNGPTRVGTAVVGRENCRLSYQCGVLVQNGGRVPSGLLSGYVHTHPGSIGFSDNDLWTAASMGARPGSTPEVTAYVCLSNGRVLAWSTRIMRDAPQANWRAYAKYGTREVR